MISPNGASYNTTTRSISSRYVVIDGASKNWAINSRQGVNRPQDRSLITRLLFSSVFIRASPASGEAKVAESTTKRSAVLLSLSNHEASNGSPRGHQNITGTSGTNNDRTSPGARATAGPRASIVICSQQTCGRLGTGI